MQSELRSSLPAIMGTIHPKIYKRVLLFVNLPSYMFFFPIDLVMPRTEYPVSNYMFWRLVENKLFLFYLFYFIY